MLLANAAAFLLFRNAIAPQHSYETTMNRILSYHQTVNAAERHLQEAAQYVSNPVGAQERAVRETRERLEASRSITLKLPARMEGSDVSSIDRG